jgi:hypothetical protein
MLKKHPPKLIYRGYEIERHDTHEGYVIKKDGEVVSSQPSVEFAQNWVDGERRKAALQGKL